MKIFQAHYELKPF